MYLLDNHMVHRRWKNGAQDSKESWFSDKDQTIEFLLVEREIDLIPDLPIEVDKAPLFRRLFG